MLQVCEGSQVEVRARTVPALWGSDPSGQDTCVVPLVLTATSGGKEKGTGSGWSGHLLQPPLRPRDARALVFHQRALPPLGRLESQGLSGAGEACQTSAQAR